MRPVLKLANLSMQLKKAVVDIALTGLFYVSGCIRYPQFNLNLNQKLLLSFQA